MHDSKDSRDQNGVELDPDQLSPGALRGLVEEYITREGTDYGHSSWSLDQKVEQVLGQLERGEVRIVFDLALESASLVTARELARYVLVSTSDESGDDDDDGQDPALS